MKFILDTNVIIRFLANDHPEQSIKSRTLFEKMANNEISLTLEPIVLAECVYVLGGKYYNYTRKEITEWLLPIVEFCEVDHKEVLISALSYFGKHNIDFADAYLASKSECIRGHVVTFNTKDFEKMGVNSFSP